MTTETKYSLTRNQARILSELDWEEDYERTLKLIHSFQIDLVIYDLIWFMEKIVPQEQARHEQEEIENNKASRADYSKVESPKVGEKYHVSWAWRGCVWKLKALMPDGRCVLETPKTKKTLIVKQADLLNIRGK